MGWIFSGDGDVNVTGVVGSTRDDDLKTTRHDRDDEEAHEGITHTGTGEVHVSRWW